MNSASNNIPVHFIMKGITLFAILAMSAVTTAYGSIEWKQKKLSIEIKPGQGAVEVSFPFVVMGSDSVTVLSTKTSDTRVVVTPIQGELKPGTEGALNVQYTPTDGVGTMIETITVSTTDPKTPKTDLRLEVYVPLTYRINPMYAFWTIGAEPTVKDVYFIDIAAKSYKPVAVYSTSTNFTATLIPPEGKTARYIIRIKPVSTTEARGGFVYVDVDMGDGTIEKRRIVAAIHEPNNRNIQIDTQ